MWNWVSREGTLGAGLKHLQLKSPLRGKAGRTGTGHKKGKSCTVKKFGKKLNFKVENPQA